MKSQSFPQTDAGPAGSAGFTIVEMLIAMGVFSMVIAAMVMTQLFGLRVYTLAATKLSATAGCRKALNQVRDEVRQAKTLDIGNCNSTPGSFNSLGLSANQVGNALKVYPTTNTNTYIVFYLDTTTATNCNLKQYSVYSNAANTALITNMVTLAGYITNQDIFTAQDYMGHTLTNEDEVDNTLQSIPNRLVIFMKLQFYQWEYPIAKVGASNVWNAYDYYQLRTKITRRAWD